MSETMFDRVGGLPFFRTLVHDFYAGVATDPVLAPMYPAEDLAGAEERLMLFLVQYWGGPKTYQEQRGHPRLRMRHQHFHIDATARDSWLMHMLAALEKQEMDPLARAEMHAYLVSAADFMMNVEPPTTGRPLLS